MQTGATHLHAQAIPPVRMGWSVSGNVSSFKVSLFLKDSKRRHYDSSSTRETDSGWRNNLNGNSRIIPKLEVDDIFYFDANQSVRFMASSVAINSIPSSSTNRQWLGFSVHAPRLK